MSFLQMQALTHLTHQSSVRFSFVAEELIVLQQCFEVSFFPHFFSVAQHGFMNKTNHSDRHSVLLLLPMALANKNSNSGQFAGIKSMQYIAHFFSWYEALSQKIGGEKQHGDGEKGQGHAGFSTEELFCLCCGQCVTCTRVFTSLCPRILKIRALICGSIAWSVVL